MWIAVLVAATAAVFAGVVRCGFIDLDDDVYVTLNPHVWQGLTPANVEWAWSNVEGANWMPLTWMTFQLDAALTGEQGSSMQEAAAGKFAPPMHATIYHLQNLFWHIGAVVLLFFLLQRLTGMRDLAGGLALLWAIHPLRVESVAWVAERKDVLATFWGLIAILCYLRWNDLRGRSRAWVWYLAASAAMALSLMGKAMAVTLPALLLLLDYWPLGGAQQRAAWWRRHFAEKIPLLALSALFSGVAIYSQTAAEAVKSTPLAERLENAVASCFQYVWMQFDCASLAIFYPLFGVPAWKIAAGSLLIAGGCVAGWRFRRTRPALLVGWLWYLISLLPVIGIVKIGEQAYADRYTYFPTIGLLLVISGLFPASLWNANGRRAALAVTAAMALVLAAITLRQVSYWKDSQTLFTRSIAVTRGNYYLRYSLAIPAMRSGNFSEAERLLKEAVAIYPGHTKAQAGLGFLYLQEERWSDAQPPLQAATRQAPDNGEFANMLGVALLRDGKLLQAEDILSREVEKHPNNLMARRNLAGVRSLLQQRPASRP